MPRHVHKYKRVKIGKKRDYEIYRCMIPGCTHYINAELIENRESICWLCDKVFVITPHLYRIKPICEDCKTGRKAGVKAKPIEDFSLEDMLANMAAKSEEPKEEEDF
jgi:hypothetical protein